MDGEGRSAWEAQGRHIEAIHPWRPRRSCFRELVQWDTSEHDWLEGRGETLCLVAMINDATSRLFAHFVRHDSTAKNMGLLPEYLECLGRPVAFCTDQAGLFQTAVRTTRGEQREGGPTGGRRHLRRLALTPAHPAEAHRRLGSNILCQRSWVTRKTARSPTTTRFATKARSVRSASRTFGLGCAAPGCASRNGWRAHSPCTSKVAI